MYVGFYTSVHTKKNQLTFPSKFKVLTGEKLFITTWFENALLILPHDTSAQIIEKILADSSPLLPEVRDLERFLYGNAEVVELDKKNRFVLSKYHREFASLKEEAIFLGVGDRVELWDYAVYQNYGKIREVQIRDTALDLYNRIKKET